MDNFQMPLFYVPDSRGDSEQIYKVVQEHTEYLKTSEIRARTGQTDRFANKMAIDNIPGVPFEKGIQNPDTFYQGEDIVYDVYLFFDGKDVSVEDYDIVAVIKSSFRAYTPVWTGVLDFGVYPIKDEPGRFELWIPSAATVDFFVGSYYLDVQVAEKIGRGDGRYDRKHVLVQTMFNINYSNFSTKIETNSIGGSTATRSDLESTWPNQPDTIGRSTALLNQLNSPTAKGTDVTQNQ
jgi:hypothetical protein